METSDDEGDSATLLTKAALLLLLFFPLTLHKSFLQRRVPPATSPSLHLRATQAAATKQPVAAKKKKKKLYITFDDGPNRGTRNVLRIVQDEGVPVSFFVVGEHVFASAMQARLWDSLKTMPHVDRCNHSFSHAHGRYESYYQQPDSVVGDFRRTHDSLRLDNTIARTPGRNIWRIDTLQFTDANKSKAAADSLQKAGFVLMGWDLEWHFDHQTMSVSTPAETLIRQMDSVFNKRRTKRQDHLVLLAHDQVYQKSADSFQLRQFLQLLKKRDDLEFSLVTRYPGAAKAADSTAENSY